jgi:hypothetical protein
MIIKSVLREEMENSLQLKKDYEKALRDLPEGALVSRIIKGHRYYYIAKRVRGKVKYIYKGKVSNEEKKKYEKAKRLRSKYRKLLSRVKKQIKYLKGTLRGKEEV